MKRFIYTALALIAAACTSTEYIDVEELEPELVLNAQMTTGSALHHIHLSSSTRSMVKAEHGATVSVTYNDSPVPETLTEDDTEGRTSASYSYTKELKAGDQLTVTAKSGSKTVTANVTVPEAPILLDASVQTDVQHATPDGIFDIGYTEPGGVYYMPEDAPYPYETWHLLKVDMKDLPGDSYYRIGAYVVTNLYDENGITKESNQRPIWLDTSAEPVFGAASTSGGMLDALAEGDNSYNLFTDSVFADKDYTLKLYFQEVQIASSRKYLSYTQNPETGEWEEQTTPPEGYTYEAYILVKLFSISFDQYIYLKALGLDDMGFLFSEPVSIPSNVEGGLGFVSVDNCVGRYIPLATL